MQCGILYILSAVVVLHVGVHNYLEFSIVQKESVAVMLLQLARLTNSLIFFLFFFTNFKFLLSYFKYKLQTDNQNYYTVTRRFGNNTNESAENCTSDKFIHDLLTQSASIVIQFI